MHSENFERFSLRVLKNAQKCTIYMLKTTLCRFKVYKKSRISPQIIYDHFFLLFNTNNWLLVVHVLAIVMVGTRIQSNENFNFRR